MTTANLIYIPLSGAFLCQDCEAIGNSNVQCPACASAALLPLAPVMNRTSPNFGLQEKGAAEATPVALNAS